MGNLINEKSDTHKMLSLTLVENILSGSAASLLFRRYLEYNKCKT